jgi:LytS/YehU family sensor histidine kinase
MDFNWAIVDAIVSNSLLLLFALIVAYPLKFYLPNKKNTPQLFGFAILLSFVWVSILQSLFSYFGFELNAPDFYNQASWILRWSVAVLIICFSVLMRWMSVVLDKQASTQLYEKQILELSKQTELKTLREQLHPHFLFNTLNSVSALIGVKPEKAREMVLQLSEFLRGSIVTKENRSHSLEEELHQISLYLEIEKVRFGHRLQTEIRCDDALKSQLVPTLILQPLVENAVKYGLYDTTDEVLIQVDCSVKDGFVSLLVRNPFDCDTAQGLGGTGFGHKSIKRNLYLLYGRADLFQQSSSDKEYMVEIKIPKS